jgi:hypothetical protein
VYPAPASGTRPKLPDQWRATPVLPGRQSSHGAETTALGVVQQRVQSDLTWLRLVRRHSQLAIASDAEPSSSLLSLRRPTSHAFRALCDDLPGEALTLAFARIGGPGIGPLLLELPVDVVDPN